MKKVLVVTVALFFAATLGFGAGRNQGTSGGGRANLTPKGTLPIVTDKVTLTGLIHEEDEVDIHSTTIWAELERRTNVHLDLQIIPEASWGTTLNLLLNSGDYPEVLFGMNLNSGDVATYGIRDKILMPLNSLIENHSVNIKEYFETYPWVRESLLASDGNLYGLPHLRGGADDGIQECMMWINKTWLDNLGLAMPTTTEEFTNVLRAFKTRDPNRNGRADEWPLAGAAGNYGGYHTDVWYPVMNAFGYIDEHNGWIALKNGKIYVPIIEDYAYQGLRYMADLWAAGLVYPASLTLDDDVLQQEIPQTGIPPIYGVLTAPWPYWGSADVALTQQYVAMRALTGPTGYKGFPWEGAKNRPANIAWAITDKCKNPEVAIRLADVYQSWESYQLTQMGTKGRDWTDPDPGATDINGNPAGFKALIDPNRPARPNNTLWAAWERMYDTRWPQEQIDAAVMDISTPLGYNYYRYQAFQTIRPDQVEMYIPSLDNTPDEVARVSQLYPGINDGIRAWMAEFINGTRPLNANTFNEFKTEIEKLGLSEYVRIKQAGYDRLPAFKKNL
jgi:putative aldouronate transport system substrate-binding protein